MKDRVAAIGASVAGVSTTAELRRLGFDGEISMIGAESWTPYHRPPLAKAVLRGAKTSSDCVLRLEHWWIDEQVDSRLGVAATGIDGDRRTVTLSAANHLLTMAWSTLATYPVGSGGLSREARTCPGA